MDKFGFSSLHTCRTNTIEFYSLVKLSPKHGLQNLYEDNTYFYVVVCFYYIKSANVGMFTSSTKTFLS